MRSAQAVNSKRRQLHQERRVGIAPTVDIRRREKERETHSAPSEKTGGARRSGTRGQKGVEEKARNSAIKGDDPKKTSSSCNQGMIGIPIQRHQAKNFSNAEVKPRQWWRKNREFIKGVRRRKNRRRGIA